jgi:hypothetical protein
VRIGGIVSFIQSIISIVNNETGRYTSFFGLCLSNSNIVRSKVSVTD